jgi:hypothetical protein
MGSFRGQVAQTLVCLEIGRFSLTVLPVWWAIERFVPSKRRFDFISPYRATKRLVELYLGRDGPLGRPRRAQRSRPTLLEGLISRQTLVCNQLQSEVCGATPVGNQSDTPPKTTAFTTCFFTVDNLVLVIPDLR